MLRAPLHRRTVLRGLGAAVALPLLEAMRPAVARAAPRAPPRLLVWFMPNGFHQPAFRPPSPGPLDALGPTCQALAPFRERLLYVSGIRNVAGDISDDPHAVGVGGIRTGHALSL